MKWKYKVQPLEVQKTGLAQGHVSPDIGIAGTKALKGNLSKSA